MPTYAYRAKDTTLKAIEGTIEAESQTAAIARLSSLGIFPVTIEEAAAPSAGRSAAGPSLRRRVNSATLAYTSRQLADLLGGGLPLFNALTLLTQQTEHRHLREVVADVGGLVREGRTFSDALATHPGVFSPLYINMIRAGETTGSLDAVLVRLADLLESESELRSRVTSALVYPSVVLAVGILTIVVLLTYVVPKLALLFTETGQLLPLPTRILLAISGALAGWWWAWLGGLVGLGWAIARFRASPAGRAVLDQALLRIPLCRTLIRKLQTARLSRNLGVMVGQGVPLLAALEVANSTVSNVQLQRATSRAREAVREGASLASALTASGQFPAFVSNMVAVGEESGSLDRALLKVAATYERETDRTLRALTTIMEPLLIVVVGLVVMFIVISMLLPIFQLGLVAQ